MENTQRFTGRTDNYVKYRPGYPPELVDCLYGEMGFAQDSVIADVGSGTGIFTRLLLERGSTVYAVEPNAEMSAAAQANLGSYPNFTPVCATAEHTGLQGGSVDFVTCAQSFHWFDRAACREEFRRILKPGGKVLVLFYRMDSEGSAFMREYEKLHFSYSIGHRTVDMRTIGDEQMRTFFRDGVYDKKCFYYTHRLDFEGLLGRMLSSSHAPQPTDESFPRMKADFERLFHAFEQDGVVEFGYRTEVLAGLV